MTVGRVLSRLLNRKELLPFPNHLNHLSDEHEECMMHVRMRRNIQQADRVAARLYIRPLKFRIGACVVTLH
jgi:hypothetical protein